MTRPRLWVWRAVSYTHLDGCGKCCLSKIEYEDTGEVEYTRVACRLLDGPSCRCSNYANRFAHVPECVRLNPKTLERIAYWLPASCDYKLLAQGKPLPDWHPCLLYTSRCV